MKNNSSGWVLFSIVFILLASLAMALEAQRAQARSVMVDASQAFLYPAEGQILLATEYGPFALQGELRSGCWGLWPAFPGQTYGNAHYMSPKCRSK